MPALANISGKVFKVSEQVVIEGSLLVFYRGEWEDDGERTALGRLRDQSPASQNRFKEQITNSLTGLQHRNILGFFGYITIEDIVYSVNPWIENGNIREYIQGNPGADRLRLLGEVASGVEFLHERGIIHGDLCGKAVLINGEGKAVVSGFGLSECSNPTLDLSRARWLAPERITASGVTLATEQGDIWSFGMVCLEVFTGADPYSPKPDLIVLVLLSQGVKPEHPGSKAVGLSPNMWELLQSCWKPNPSDRPSMYSIASWIHGVRPRRPTVAGSRQLSSVTLEEPFDTPMSRPTDSILSAGTSFRTAHSSYTSLARTSARNPLHGAQVPSLLAAVAPPIETIYQQTETPVQTGHFSGSSNSSPSVLGRLAPLVEEPYAIDDHTEVPLSSPSDSEWRSQSGPYTPASLSTSSGSRPPFPIPPPSRHQFTADSSSSQSTSSTRESGARRKWSFLSGRGTRTTLDTSPDVNCDPLPPSTSNSDTLSVHNRAQQANPSTPIRAQTIPVGITNAIASQISRSASLPVPSHQSRVSPVVLELLEKVASDSESLLRHAADGSVSAGNLEGLVSRVIINTANPPQDTRFRDAFLIVSPLFATGDRIFEILKRRFGSMDIDPLAAHIRSRYNILLFIGNWLKKGFEDEELKCSTRIKEFALAIRGSSTMEERAQEIASLIDNPDFIHLRQPGGCARLRREPAERPRGLTPTDLATALTVVEGERFKCITHWDYVNFIRGRSSARRRIEVFNTVHDSIAVWAKRSVLQSNDIGERTKAYEEWIDVAKACRKMNNFSSVAAIVFALTSSAITGLALTCESKARPILHELAKDFATTNDTYQNTLQQATTRTTDLIPWLDPLLSSLNSTFVHSNPIVEVDGHALIDFKQCIMLAEQIDPLVQYSPSLDRSAIRSEILAYVEYNLKSCVGNDALRYVEARSIELVNKERSLHQHRGRMRLLGMPWVPPS